VWLPALKGARIPEPLPRAHDLRHTAASLAIQAGAHPKAIQSMLGHSTITMTLDRYGHFFPSLAEGLAAAVDATSKLLPLCVLPQCCLRALREWSRSSSEEGTRGLTWSFTCGPEGNRTPDLLPADLFRGSLPTCPNAQKPWSDHVQASP
jgi:hypothetical protein